MVICMTKERVLKLQSKLSKGQGALITSDSNRFYFTGFKTSAGSVLITQEDAVFFTDSRYFEKAQSVVKSCRVVLLVKGILIAETASELGIDTLFIETENTSISQYNRRCIEFEGIEVSKDTFLDRVIADMRVVKCEDELRLIRKAQAITDMTFSYICERIDVGRSEREIMLDMEFFMRKQGSEGVAFDFIVVSGKNSSLPHGVPSEKKIEKGDFVTMDFGAVIGGYRSDMTRTVAVGFVSDEQRTVYNTVLTAQMAAIKSIKAGAVCGDIDKIARDIIYDAGFKGRFGHALGHSVGIDIHEGPNFSPDNKAVLNPNVVMTVEPGIYLEGKFGVRIEDMVFVTDNTCENITKSNKNLMIL